MLGKLIKYEFKDTWKLIVPMNLFMVLMSLLACATVQLSFFDSDNELVVMTGALVIVTYILSLVAILIVTVIYLIYRFYTSVYGDEGYLLHTLPVDKHHIIISKALVSAVWIIIEAALISISIFLILFSSRSFVDAFIGEGMDYYLYQDLFEDVSVFSMVMTLIASLTSLAAKILKISACISLGQLSSNHKVLMSFGFYYAIYFVQKIFSMIYYTMVSLAGEIADTADSVSSLLNGWEFNLISGLIYSAVFYILTWFVMEKKLNLD